MEPQLYAPPQPGLPAPRPKLRLLRSLRWLSARLRVLPPSTLALLAETFVFLLAAKLALRFLPIQRVISWKQAEPPSSLTADGVIDSIAWAIATVAARSPIHFVCFPQCLAAAALLRRRAIASRLHYGAARERDVLVTHTWLEAGGRVIVGHDVAARFSELAVY